MDREANYVTVGAFVLLMLAMAAGFVLWYSDTSDGQAMRRYEIYFGASVSGLSEGSNVRYLGVVVGRVTRIGIDPRDPRRVRVVVDIAEDAPVTPDTVARLTLQGVTGLLFVDLRPRDPGAIPMEPIESLKFPVIASSQSQFDVLVSALPEVMSKAGQALERINGLLSDKNITSVTNTLANLETASEQMPAAVSDARVTFNDLKEAANEMEATMKALGSIGGEDVKAASTRLREVADTIAVTASRLDRLVAENEENVDRFAEQGLADFEQLVRESRSAVRSIEALSKSLERDPSRVIYRPSPAGVEIPP